MVLREGLRLERCTAERIFRLSILYDGVRGDERVASSSAGVRAMHVDALGGLLGNSLEAGSGKFIHVQNVVTNSYICHARWRRV